MTADYKTDYKNSVFLPATSFSMKAGLPDLEPTLLGRWQAMDLYGRVRAASAGRPKFILHDGPPYANGHLHLGHALNKILKDIVIRGQQMSGKDAPYVPGWDCHGLPIEWKIEERYREAGLDKDKVDPVTFRRECRAFAEGWIDVQREEFQRLGLLGDWANPYTTMDFRAEAQIVRELGQFALRGDLYKGAKPVLWSVVEKTALAEAEVEYHDHVSVTIWVRFPVVSAPQADLAGASVVIWTTTPWTMPGNRAVAFGSEMTYGLYQIRAVEEGSLAQPGETLLLSVTLADQVLRDAKVTDKVCLRTFQGSELTGALLRHPLAQHPDANGFFGAAPLLAGDFVTDDAGTGFVHIAPGHGEDDWRLGMQHGLTIPETVQPDGSYHPKLPIFAGINVLARGKDGKYYSPAARPVIDALKSQGTLLHSGKLTHSYPHSWRSKAPLIFRTTPQWFIAMDNSHHLRDTALAAIDATRFVPPQGQRRLRAMVEGRPDWCVSRQRAWGVPITIFVHKTTGDVLKDPDVMDRIATAVEAEGADAWYTRPAAEFLGPNYDAADYEQVTDILDVWFDSGCTHSFVLAHGRWDLQWPADVYLEGSDQHRGWFQSSLLESCGNRGRAPYDTVLTHGFLLDEHGRKMSKSLGNGVELPDVVGSMGADIVRLWVACSDYAEDVRIGPEIIKTQVDVYRRLRNSLRYLLGALDGFHESERLDFADQPQLERWVLHRLTEMDLAVRRSLQDFQFHSLFAELTTFCTNDLSAFYFDVRKDSLYCDHPIDPRRRAARTVMDVVFTCLSRWLAPFLCFTAEEAYLARHPGTTGSVHLEQFPELPMAWRDEKLASRWADIRDVRRVVTGALEVERAAKRIGSSLQAAPKLYVTDRHAAALAGIEMEEICITSALEILQAAPPGDSFQIAEIEGVGVVFATALGEKCARCWKILPDVGQHSHEALCARCDDVMTRLSPA
jgi:isoleucyl-tRNA synthetase